MPTAPTFVKTSHVSFSCTDLDRSTAFLRDVLGFRDLERVEGDGWRGLVMVHPPSGTVLEYQHHDGNGGERFDPARTGLDHLGLMVAAPEELEAWQGRFEELGVDHTPVVHEPYGSVLTFRDPDGVQLELFFRAGHP